MSWDTRAQAYRDSPTHREGADLDLLVSWAEGESALDVATGGGHVARRLREAGFRVVSCDSSPAMEPDVLCSAEDLPFADGSFDVVACRLAAHHFVDVDTAVGELARVSRALVLLEDILYAGEAVEEAERLRDPSHVGSLSEPQWRGLFEEAGLELEALELLVQRHPLEPWLERTGCAGFEAERVRALLAHRIESGLYTDTRILLRGRKR